VSCFGICEIAKEADFSIDRAAKGCLRRIRSQGCAKRTAFRGDRFAVVLEFEFFSGKMVGMQSMET
jgi:hypothetical protein